MLYYPFKKDFVAGAYKEIKELTEKGTIPTY
jgi:hypothetical protein